MINIKINPCFSCGLNPNYYDNSEDNKIISDKNDKNDTNWVCLKSYILCHKCKHHVIDGDINEAIKLWNSKDVIQVEGIFL
jgi:hypothetical protein